MVNAETLSFKDASITINYTRELNIIAGMYKQVFNRQADLNGIEYWATQKLTTNMSYGEMALHMDSKRVYKQIWKPNRE